jgi:hypothetical protein
VEVGDAVRTGAGDGGREFRAASNLKGLDTGSHPFDEDKKRKAAERLARRAARQARKNGW